MTCRHFGSTPYHKSTKAFRWENRKTFSSKLFEIQMSWMTIIVCKLFLMGFVCWYGVVWKCFVHYWSFVSGIHLSPVDSHHNGPMMQNILWATKNGPVMQKRYHICLVLAWEGYRTNNSPVIWDVMTAIWRHCNGIIRTIVSWVVWCWKAETRFIVQNKTVTLLRFAPLRVDSRFAPS